MIDQDEILANFVEESQQHLQTIEPDLLEIEQGGGKVDFEVVNRVFRAIHSVKGAAGFFGLMKIGELSHVMENLLSLLRDGKIEPNPDLIDALLEGVDALRAMVDDIGASEKMDIQKELTRLQDLLENKGTTVKKVTVAEKTKPVDVDRPPRLLEVPEDDIRRFVKNGQHLYIVKIYLKRDLQAKDRTPFDFINNMESTGQFVDAVLDISKVSGLDDCLINDLAFDFIYASILETDMIPTALDVPEEQVNTMDLGKYIQESRTNLDGLKKAASVLSAKATAQPQTPEPVVPVEPKAKPDGALALAVEPSGKKPAPKTEEKALRANVQTEEKIRVGVNLLNDLVNLAGEMVLGRNQLLQIAGPLVRETPGLNPILQHVSRITTEMQERIMQMRMQPVSMVFSKFQRVVRDLAKKLDKEIKLVTFGEDVELDKSIIEALSDPLTHLIRNSVDHGIESPDEREKAGKSRQGTIELKAYHQAGQVHLEIADDGGGIDTQRVKEKAFEKGLATAEQLKGMSEKDLARLIFKPGFSTAKQVSAVSGRGVGMDVVLTNIEQLGGTVDIDTELHRGTTIRLILPLTLAIVSGLVIRVKDQYFIMPEANIDEIVRIKPDEIKTRINIVQEAQVLRLRDRLLPLIDLKKVLGLSAKDKTEALQEGVQSRDPVRVLVTRYGDSRLGIIVDNLENIEEIVVKPLPRFLKKMQCYSGASIMGNGTVSLILDVAGIVEKSKLHNLEEIKAEAARTAGLKSAEAASQQETQTLLLFDNDTKERFGLPLELITRVERVPISSIEHVRDNQYLQYQGDKLRLLFLEDHLPITRPQRKPEDYIGVIIPKQIKKPMGIVINRVIGTINTTINLDAKTIMAPGLFGSAVIDGKITLLPDMYRMFELAAPEWYLGDNGHQPKDGTQKRILLVDDIAFFRMVERDYLKSAGYEVIEAENGKRALEILSEKDVDAVILDIIMPVMDGWETIRHIRANERFKDLPVMAVTSLSEDTDARRGMVEGFTEWESKLNKTRLLEKLATLLNKETAS